MSNVVSLRDDVWIGVSHGTTHWGDDVWIFDIHYDGCFSCDDFAHTLAEAERKAAAYRKDGLRVIWTGEIQ